MADLAPRPRPRPELALHLVDENQEAIDAFISVQAATLPVLAPSGGRELRDVSLAGGAKRGPAVGARLWTGLTARES